MEFLFTILFSSFLFRRTYIFGLWVLFKRYCSKVNSNLHYSHILFIFRRQKGNIKTNRVSNDFLEMNLKHLHLKQVEKMEL